MRYSAALFLCLAFAVPALGQMPGEGAVYVSISDLSMSSSLYHDRLVRVVGELMHGDYADTQNRIYVLQGDSGLDRVRVGQPSGAMQDLTFLVGRKVEIVGVFWDMSLMASNRRLRQFPGARRSNDVAGIMESHLFIGVYDVIPMEEEPEPESADTNTDEVPGEVERPDLPSSDTVDLRELIRNPEPYYERLVSVIGKYRADNVYGDLPMDTKRTPRDFIIKVADTAIWVTGKRPEGDGFELLPDRRRDTGNWLKVIGVPWTDEGNVYLRARHIELVDDPEDPDLEPRTIEEEIAEIEEEEPPPEVIFSVPLNGERRVPLDSEFRIQFSKDMNRASFDRNIDLLYADDVGDGNPFPNLRVSYDAHSRSLVVAPGKRLEPGKEIHLVLYRGIKDDGDRPLVVDPEADVLGAAAVLRFFTTDAE